jgi:hypothetical protein
VSDQSQEPRCKRCHREASRLARADSFDRISLADDPADPNCGHYYLEAVYVMQCPACGHRQELVNSRTAYATLREAQTEMDAHLLGKG